MSLAARWPAWQELIEAMQPASLLVVIHSRVPHDLGLDAEDILQETIARAWHRREQTMWQGFRATRSWLLTIADHCIADARDHATALKRGGGNVRVMSSVSPPGAPALDAARSTTPSKIASYREHAAILRAAFEDLPEDVRDITRLRLMEQRTMREIAEHTGLPLATVQHRVRRGSELFRERVRSRIALSTLAAAPDRATASVSVEDAGETRDQPRTLRP
jgi:RNA polymerase sigma factor (sigma-70 family)